MGGYAGLERGSGLYRFVDRLPLIRPAPPATFSLWEKQPAPSGTGERTRTRVPLLWAMSTGNQGAALMLVAELRSDVKIAKQALEQIEVAFTTMRDGGQAQNAAFYGALLPHARALVARLSNAGKKKTSAKR